MSPEKSYPQIPIEKLRWRLDPSTLPFETTDNIEPLKEIIGQKRGVEAFRFGINMNKPGYNVFVTGTAGSGRMATVKRLLEEMSKKDQTPEDLCYVNCFKDPESPVLIRLPGGTGSTFKRDVKNLVERLMIMTPGEVIRAKHIPAPFNGSVGLDESFESAFEVELLREAKSRFERAFIEKKLKEFAGNISQTAEAIGIERSNLHKKIKSYGLTSNGK